MEPQVTKAGLAPMQAPGRVGDAHLGAIMGFDQPGTVAES
jgi:hypothetical protein